jgi:hypothetical protein
MGMGRMSQRRSNCEGPYPANGYKATCTFVLHFFMMHCRIYLNYHDIYFSMILFGFTLIRACDLQKALGYSAWTSLCSHPKSSMKWS